MHDPLFERETIQERENEEEEEEEQGGGGGEQVGDNFDCETLLNRDDSHQGIKENIDNNNDNDDDDNNDDNDNNDNDDDDNMTPLSFAEFQSSHPEYFHALPSPASFGAVACYPFLSGAAYFRRLVGCFSLRFVLLCLSANLLKGGLYQVLLSAQLPYVKDYLGLSGTMYQRYYSASLLPWSLKGLLGALSDLLPVAGLHKRWYVLGAALLGSLACACLGLFDFAAPQAALVACLFALVHLEVAFVDLLVEGRYAEMMRRMPHTGADIVTWIWAVYFAAALAAAALVGPLADARRFRLIFLLALPVALQVVAPTLLGWLRERPARPRGFQRAKFARHARVWALAGLGGACALLLFGANLYAPPAAIFLLSVASSALLSGALFWAFERPLAKAVFYNFLVKASYVNLSGALSYFYTSPPPCVAGGPAFSWTYFQTVSGVAQTLFGVVGTLLFQALMGRWSIRRVFWVSILLRSLASWVDIALVNRWNLAVGIGDRLFYMFGFNVLAQVTYQLEFMGGVVLTSKLCSPTIETTTYAILAGFANFGIAIAGNIGTFMIHQFGIATSAPCNFDNLAWLVFVGHFCLPLLAFPLSFWLLPVWKVTDNILEVSLEPATTEMHDDPALQMTDGVHSIDEMSSIDDANSIDSPYPSASAFPSSPSSSSSSTFPSLELYENNVTLLEKIKNQ